MTTSKPDYLKYPATPSYPGLSGSGAGGVPADPGNEAPAPSWSAAPQAPPPDAVPPEASLFTAAETIPGIPSGFDSPEPGSLQSVPDYHAPEALIPSSVNPENTASLRSFPDYHAPEAALPADLNPENLGSIQSLPDYRVPEAALPADLDLENAAALDGSPGAKPPGAAASPELPSAAELPSLGGFGADPESLFSGPTLLNSQVAYEAARNFLAASLDLGVFGETDPQGASPAYSPVIEPADEGSLPPREGGSAKKPGSPETGKPPAYVGARPVSRIRDDFPILHEKVEGGRRLVWFDNAATTQKPVQVIERLVKYYREENSNVHRGAHALAARATDAYEAAREKVARFIGAKSSRNIVFARGTTEAINLIANSYVLPRLSAGDEIIVSNLEHHANIVPWQLVAAKSGARLRVIPVDERGQIVFPEYLKLFNPRTRFVSVTHVSNSLGTVTPVASLVGAAHARGVPINIDGAQSISHIPVDVTALNPDFFVFSGHKIYGPTGIGAIYGTDEVLTAAEPYQGGGNMIADVTFEKTVYQGHPQKFEAGTGNIGGAVGLGAALDYVSDVGILNIQNYEESLLRYATDLLSKLPRVTIIGTAPTKASVISFIVEGAAIEEVGTKLSAAGIAVRAGHHCSQPILRRFGLEGTVRASLAFYNTAEEVEYFVSVLKEIAP
ncbi:MAG: SufS family cysteine desulfurase [Deltaproteobacteria bacterium]|jgi:cysteine desulfurase/selenocysteine lyase|nr:SufS family cysteine desulfurase [Deltaproteobacteria bacterium]